ncbi:MAG TPA: hypothetical protein DEG17_18925 [Cyanobacteria bacterium UBA11149]|nr:hypothetical protein [Cyanobacteria bacterium UBA11366]HBR76028.1 hypothetical protein [Cyanobacteria bacterium UBA11159]HBS71040.1 hypothetical protein [Cyanobacteria bacterium UBA11153]HBW90884.1 hypothetical protein [Cyanobacteria bacterium UBA11149]HCA96217.1 hypothetical protein [Cyanobacteria bacterium UBA9226]
MLLLYITAKEGVLIVIRKKLESWSLVIGYWLFIVGYLLLVICCWLFVVGYLFNNQRLGLIVLHLLQQLAFSPLP